MNAVTYYGELFDWVLSHVRDADMFLVQSVVTCGALFWCVSMDGLPSTQGLIVI